MRAGPLVLLALGVSWLSAACGEPAEPPPACRAYLGCFYPAGESSDDESPYAGHETYQELAKQREAAIAVYGAGGECWRFGLDDALAVRCAESCLAALDASCRSFEAGGDEGFCVTTRGGKSWFDGGEASLACDFVAAEVEKIPGEGTSSEGAP